MITILFKKESGYINGLSRYIETLSMLYPANLSQIKVIHAEKTGNIYIIETRTKVVHKNASQQDKKTMLAIIESFSKIGL